MCCSSDEFEEDHPVAAQTIECLVGMLGACGFVLVFILAPILTIILVFVRIISPWWLFLGCGPLALMLCISCCGVCAMIVSENYIKYERPVTAHAIDRFWIRLAASCCVLVFFVAPIVVIVLVEERIVSENYIKYERPVTAHAIDRFWIRLAASCCVLVFFVAPIVVIVLVEERIVSENYIKYERPVTAHAIDRFWIRLAASCCVLVFFVAPIVVIVLVEERKISPWWLFLGCGPLALGLCLSCCAVCAKIAFDHLFEDLCETDSSLTQSTSV